MIVVHIEKVVGVDVEVLNLYPFAVMQKFDETNQHKLCRNLNYASLLQHVLCFVARYMYAGDNP